MGILDFFRRKDEQIAQMEGKRGVTALRAQRDLLRKTHQQHEHNLADKRRAPRNEYDIQYARERIAALAATQPQRDAYGALRSPNVPRRLVNHPQLRHLAWSAEADQIIARAQRAKLLPSEYADFDSHGRGDCLNIDLYGYVPGLVLVQVRRTTVSKWGTSPRKQYIVTDGVRAVEVSKNKIRRAAEQVSDLDAPMRAIKSELPAEWQAKIGEPLKLQNHVARTTAYKIVVRDGNKLVSAYDGVTEYKLGKQLKQKARPDHEGGFYAYADVQQLREHPEKILNEDWIRGKTLVILECECAGTPVHYGQKQAYSMITPRAIVAEWQYPQ